MMNEKMYKQMAFDYELYLALEEMFRETFCMNGAMARKLLEENNQLRTDERDCMTKAARDARNQIEGKVPASFRNSFVSVYLLRNLSRDGKPCRETRIVFANDEYMLEVAARPQCFMLNDKGSHGKDGRKEKKSPEKARVLMRLYRNVSVMKAA